jgi:hypothetical protein
MSRRINVMIDDDTWTVLEKVPAGERSRTVNEALRSWVQRRHRRDAARAMDSLRGKMPVVSAGDIVRWIREDRDRHH